MALKNNDLVICFTVILEYTIFSCTKFESYLREMQNKARKFSEKPTCNLKIATAMGGMILAYVSELHTAMLEAISTLNQTATVAQFRHAPTWPVETMNFSRYGYTVHLNPELQMGHIAASLLDPNPPQQISSSPVLYHAVPPYIVPVSNSSQPLTVVHGLDAHIEYEYRAFTEHLIEIRRINAYAIDKRGSRCAESAARLKLSNAISNDTFHHSAILLRLNCGKLDGTEKDLSLDQNGNHVIQKIFSCVPFYGYNGIVSKYLASADVLNEVVKDKYGCRVIQLSIESTTDCVILRYFLIAGYPKYFTISDQSWKKKLQKFQTCSITSPAACFYASRELLVLFNSSVCKLRNSTYHNVEYIRNASQYDNMRASEKYASHVVEKALKHAPPKLLHAMMNEILDGYECDTFSRKGHDALDILLFDQFGNYVIQTMLEIAVETREKKRVGNDSWFNRLAERIVRSQHKLMKYSSGKRILEKLGMAISNDKNMSEDENFDFVLNCTESCLRSVTEHYWFSYSLRFHHSQVNYRAKTKKRLRTITLHANSLAYNAIRPAIGGVSLCGRRGPIRT
ncbi:Pumilio-family RNA binding repeat containing protein [Dirofilaria immitis]|nr:Pumilio-family RNA binding repeat containing protein [Dirofilaria immitis]